MLFQIATQGMTRLDDLQTEIGDLQKCVIRIFQQGPFDVEILSRLLSFLLNIVDVATVDQALKIISDIPHVTEFLIKFIMGAESAAKAKFEDDKLRNCALQVIHKLLLKHKMSQPRLYTETLLGQLSAYGFIPALSSAWQGGQVASNLFTIQILELLSNLAKAQVSSSCGLSFVYEIMSDGNLSSMLSTCGSSHNSIIVEHVLKIHSHNVQSYLLAGCLPDEYLTAFQICSLVVSILDKCDQHSFQAQAFALYIIADIIEFSDHSSVGIEELLQMNVFYLLTTYLIKCKNEKNFEEAQKIVDWIEECCPETVAYVSPRRLIPSETSTPIISNLYFNI
ncbi:hypothetical protein FGO68_gene4408 [Halteria grandinella]|uniref:Uncharacterized protein n=1 Tax=Halteria grandinella TaxID=5974 RepID=A0A8J8NTY5_HALGN|nr:hypothetical protein FGO68_gene4408 [Halteria grandinella]